MTLLYAIRSELPMLDKYYGYAAKSESGMTYLDWYPTLFSATKYKNKQSANRRARYYKNLGIKCEVIEVRAYPGKSGFDGFVDIELKAREDYWINKYAL